MFWDNYVFVCMGGGSTLQYLGSGAPAAVLFGGIVDEIFVLLRISGKPIMIGFLVIQGT